MVPILTGDQRNAFVRKVAWALVSYGLVVTVAGGYWASQPLRFALRHWPDSLLPWLWDSIVATFAVVVIGPFLIIVGIQLWKRRPSARNALEAFLWIGAFAVPVGGIALIFPLALRKQPFGLVLPAAVILAHWLSIIALLIWVRLDHVKRQFSVRSAE